MSELIRTFAALEDGAQAGIIVILLICWWGTIQSIRALRGK